MGIMTRVACFFILAILSQGLSSFGLDNKQETMVPGLALEPEYLNFGEVERGRPSVKTCKLIQTDTRNVRLKRIELSADHFTAHVSPGQGEFKIEVVLKPDAPVGLFAEKMILITDSAEKPGIEVPIYGNVVGRIRAAPQTVLLGIINRGGRVSSDIEVASVDRKSFNILRITSNPSFLSAEVTRTKKDWKSKITIEVAEDAPAGRVAGKICIHTDDSDQPLIEVPFYGLVTNTVRRLTPNTKDSPATRDSQAFKHIFITRPPIEVDTYLSAWLIKRFLDPMAEFVFVPIGSPVVEEAGCIFDLPSPHARWIRRNRRCTSEHVLAEIKRQTPAIRKMVGFVRQLEMASWLVSPASDAGRLRSTIVGMTTGTTDPQLRIDRVFTYLDDVYAAGGCVSR